MSMQRGRQGVHFRATHYSEQQRAVGAFPLGAKLGVRDGAKEALDDANQVVSDLAYWVTSCDRDAALRMAEGFGAALAKSASMRSRGIDAIAIALALAERANALSHLKDAQHAGWLLLSLKLELLQLASSASSLPGRQAAELLLELDQIMIELLQKGAAALNAA